MATYLSPGVYVEEKPSEIKPIAGVGTSTAGFIGFFGDDFKIPRLNPKYDPTKEIVAPKPLTAPEPLRGEITKVEGTVYTVKDSGTGTEYSSDATTEVEANLRVRNKIEYTLNAEKTGLATIKRSPSAPATTPGSAAGNETFVLEPFTPRPAGEVVLCTNFTEFRQAFGDFSTDPGQSNLAHGVYGFFLNGGTRVWVARERDKSQINHVLGKFEGIDEIALVVAPGVCDQDSQEALLSHCEKLGERFAILDTPKEVGSRETPEVQKLMSGDRNFVPRDSNYGAVYFPWIEVSDPATKVQKPKESGRISMAPSGHIAGIFARVDHERGVHKAPANETVRGALDLRYYISKAHQESLNPLGVNCIRDINGSIKVWGARTIGGDRQNEWKYINIRRTFLYLRESIDEGTQWIVFEPNDRMLWGKIVRNVSAFLYNVWRDGALFGSTAQEAFYVKCDDETNPPSIREQGQVVTEIGVALTRPAEFVIFHISQWGGPQKQ